nr:MAG TPA: hypothetical protein [Caudoviricetes sp.]
MEYRQKCKGLEKSTTTNAISYRCSFTYKRWSTVCTL